MIYKWLTPYVTLPLHDRLTGQYAWLKVQELKRLQWLPLEELKQRASSKLCHLVNYAYKRVPYYTGIFDQAGLGPDDISSVDDLKLFPVTQPETVRHKFKDEMLARLIPASRREESFTSGSSGFPLKFYGDKEAKPEVRASLLYFRDLAGINPWDAALWLTSPSHMRSFDNEIKNWERIARSLLIGEQIHLISGDDISVEALMSFSQKLPKSKDYFIFGFPSHLIELIRQISFRQPLAFKRPKAVISYAQNLAPEQAERIGQFLGCRVFDMYSCREALFMALSCPDNPSLMHVNTERVWLRVVDERGRDCRPGETGRVLITDLHNQVMPLINYDVGDLAQPGPVCSCGRGFPTLLNLEGRTSECLQLPQGKIASANTVGRLLFFQNRFLPFIWEYQVHQHGEGRITLKIVPTSEISNEVIQEMKTHLQAYLGSQVIINIQVVKSLPVDQYSGKRPVIVSHMSPLQSCLNRRHMQSAG